MLKLRADGLTYQAIAAKIGFCLATVRRHLNEKAVQNHAKYYRTHKKQVAESRAKYQRAHKDEIAKYKADYYKTHKVQEIEYAASYSQVHKDEKAKYNANYHKTHRKERSLYAAKRGQIHKKKIAKRKARYYRKHKVQFMVRNAQRRALKHKATIGATSAQLVEIAEIYRCAKEAPRVRCYLCGKLIPKGRRQVDHIVPLSKGGLHRPSNLAVACDICNLKKNDKFPMEIGLLL